jgi:hypothetical protein
MSVDFAPKGDLRGFHRSERVTDQGGLSGETNVNSGGLTTFLWIKQFFGICGELW